MIFAGNLLGRYCGNTLPAAVDTSDSFAYVKFVTDGSVNARGFRLHFVSSTEGWICEVEICSQEATYTTDHNCSNTAYTVDQLFLLFLEWCGFVFKFKLGRSLNRALWQQPSWAETWWSKQSPAAMDVVFSGTRKHTPPHLFSSTVTRGMPQHTLPISLLINRSTYYGIQWPSQGKIFSYVHVKFRVFQFVPIAPFLEHNDFKELLWSGLRT